MVRAILVVEDNLGDVSLIRQTLAEGTPEAEMTAVGSVAAALSALEAAVFDCVLLDLGLPDAAGLDGLAALLEQGAPPILVLTGQDDQELALAAIGRGAEDYLAKTGLAPDVLARALRYAVERRAATDLLWRQAAQYRWTVESLGEGLVVYGRDGTVLSYNSAAERIFGSADRLSCLAGGTEGGLLLLPDGTTIEPRGTPVRTALETGFPVVDLTVGATRPNGELRWLSVNCVPVPEPDQAGEMGVVVSFQDVTISRQAERRVQLGFEQAAMGLALAGGDGRFTEVNPALCSILGRSRDDLIGSVLTDYAVAGPSRAYYSSELISPAQDQHAAEMEFFRPDGTVVWLSAITTLVREVGAEAYWFEQVRDISDSKRTEAALEQLAISDPLTNLPNRNLLNDRVERALVRARQAGSRTALFLVGIDRFKAINDALGHSAGDALLVAFADLLRLAAPDVTVARFGGDVFAVVIERVVTLDDAVEWSQQHLLAASNGKFEVEGSEVYVTSSTGIALSSSGATADDLIRNADLAMNRAKAAGGGHAVAFEEKDLEALRERLDLETDLRIAITQQQISVVYQPVVRIDNHRIIGAEALARWHHPRWGHVPPDTFIAVAERLGLMSGLTSHVLGVACAQVAAWKMEGRVADDFRVAVNLSADDLAGPGLVDVVRGALDGSGLDAGSLTVEVTETGLVRDTGTALAVLKAIRRLGARIAIDDFGTGYSSLSYLKMFPVDVVKIDKSFVFGLGRDAEATALVRGILSLTRALGLTAVAEGIENDVQLEALRQMGCPLAQGYFFSRPVPADQFPSTLSIAPAPDGDALLAQAQLAPVVADGGADLGWAVLDALPTAVAVVGPDGIILATNLAWKRFALDNGANASSCGVGVDYLAVCENARGVGAEDASLAARGLRAVLAGDRDAFTLEYDCDSPIQRRRFLMTASPVASGVGAAVVAHLDITASHLAELAFDESADRFRNIFEQAPLGIFSLGADGRVVDANQALCGILGRSPEDLHGALRSDLFGERVDFPESRPDSRRDGPRYSRYRARRPDGTVIVAQVNDVVVDDGKDGAHTLVATVEDITERLRLVEDLQRAQEMEALGRLAAGIAHQVNSPMQFISENLTFLSSSWRTVAGVLGALRSAAAQLQAANAASEIAALLTGISAGPELHLIEAEVPAALRRSHEGVERVAMIVRAMKAFGDPDKAEPEPTNINRLISNTVIMARNELKSIADVATDLGDLPAVVCYPGAVGQVVLNLLVNAAYAVSEAREVTWGRGLITIKTWVNGAEACISVSDNGPGIPPDVLAHIFEPFFTTKPLGHGTGQGLALAWATIVDRHNGHIDVATSEAGTTFVLHLPLGERGTEPRALAPVMVGTPNG